MLSMGRAARIDIEDGWCHVMNRGVARQETFLADEDRVEFGRLLGVGHERFGVEVHAYCLMPNHYHLLLHCPSAGLSGFMHQLGSVYTRHVNDRVGRDGPLFRGRFHSIPIAGDRQLLATVRYIHRNALDLTGVTSAADYRWSSHRAYLGHRRPAPWLRTDDVLAHFGDVGAFSDFVETGVAVRSQPFPALGPNTLSSVIDLVLDELNASSEPVPHGIARTVMLVIADRLGSPAADEVLASMHFANAHAQVVAVRRARRRAASDPLLAVVADRVVELAYTWCLAPGVRRLSA
jgi:REP element-mobilizing transposase RayT